MKNFLGVSSDQWREVFLNLAANAIKCVGYGIGLAIILIVANSIISFVK